MKKIYFIWALPLFILACSSSIQPNPTPVEFDEFALGATQIAIMTSTTPTIIAVQPTQETNVSTQSIFRDEFEKSIDTEWKLINENPYNWSLTTKVGFLQITSTGGYFSLGNASNVLLRPAPQGDYILETSLLFEADESDQFAGIIAAESNQNFVQVGIGYCPITVGCVEHGLYVDIYQNGKLTLPRNMTKVSLDALFIRLVFQDNTLTVFTSHDGYSWFRMVEKDLVMNIQQVGLISAQNNSENIEIASFDYFEIRPISP